MLDPSMNLTDQEIAAIRRDEMGDPHPEPELGDQGAYVDGKVEQLAAQLEAHNEALRAEFRRRWDEATNDEQWEAALRWFGRECRLLEPVRTAAIQPLESMAASYRHDLASARRKKRDEYPEGKLGDVVGSRVLLEAEVTYDTMGCLYLTVPDGEGGEIDLGVVGHNGDGCDPTKVMGDLVLCERITEKVPVRVVTEPPVQI